ncbi:unnamed protein product [Closterium sp. Naga37s-1]|nr:unnamed protein product [Closterium sp. Naga37s-1]
MEAPSHPPTHSHLFPPTHSHLFPPTHSHLFPPTHSHLFPPTHSHLFPPTHSHLFPPTHSHLFLPTHPRIPTYFHPPISTYFHPPIPTYFHPPIPTYFHPPIPTYSHPPTHAFPPISTHPFPPISTHPFPPISTHPFPPIPTHPFAPTDSHPPPRGEAASGRMGSNAWRERGGSWRGRGGMGGQPRGRGKAEGEDKGLVVAALVGGLLPLHKAGELLPAVSSSFPALSHPSPLAPFPPLTLSLFPAHFTLFTLPLSHPFPPSPSFSVRHAFRSRPLTCLRGRGERISAHGLPAQRCAVAVLSLVEQAQYAQRNSAPSCPARTTAARGTPWGPSWFLTTDADSQSNGHEWMVGAALPTPSLSSPPSPSFAPPPDPVFMLSPLGMHACNLQSDPCCIVVVQIPGWSGLANARATIFGDLYPLPPSQQVCFVIANLRFCDCCRPAPCNAALPITSPASFPAFFPRSPPYREP